MGIPVALYVSSLVEKSSEGERKRKILILLRAELEQNRNLIEQWFHSPTNREDVSIVAYDINTEVWDAFSDGGEIQWIKDPEVLGKLSNAFFSLKNLRELGSWTDTMEHYAINPTQAQKDGVWGRLMQKPDTCIETLSAAISLIDRVLRK